MTISSKSAKLLWANAAGRCSFPECRLKLTSDPSRVSDAFTLGEMAHIRGDRAGSNRHDPAQSPEQRDAYENLILLCPTHHALVDKAENEQQFPVEALLKFKAGHEEFVSCRLMGRDYSTKNDVAREALPLIQENHHSFINYGPLSEIARRNPQSDAHRVWLEERLTVIAPNNRILSQLLRAQRRLFSSEESPVIAKFLQHARSYEGWVKGATSYEGVPRFPADFAELMEKLAHARA